MSWSGDMLQKWDVEKQYKRWCKKSVCFRLKGDKEGSYRTIDLKYGLERIVAHLKQKHGDQLEEILNDRFKN